MGCSLLSIVEILYLIFLALQTAVLRLHRKITPQKSVFPKIMQVIPAPESTRIDEIFAILNSLSNTFRENQNFFEEKLKHIEENQQKLHEKIEQIDFRLEELEKIKT